VPFELRLPNLALAQSWKLKVRENERNEEPHVSVIFKGSAVYRYGLRRRGFLDTAPDPRLVPDEIVAFIVEHLDEFITNWDRMYPENPCSSTGDDDE
jgi:hypothetical protein